MNILLTNHTLSTIGGSETFTYTIAIELNKRKDVNLDVFSPKLGLVSDKLKSMGINVINKITKDYDYVMASHISTINHLKNITGLKIQTCHGIFVNEERIDRRVDKYVSISEEVYESLKKNNVESTLILNGVDCERFYPKNLLNNKVKTILSLSQSEPLNIMIKKVCDKLGINLICLNKFKNPIFDVEDIINESDLVISLGRGVYESMACGRNVIILDKRPYVPGNPIGDGIISENNIDNYIKNNCSGRFSKKQFNEKDLINEINKYNVEYGDFNRNYAIKNLNIINKVNNYIKIYEDNRIIKN